MLTIQLKPFYYRGQECIGLHGPDSGGFNAIIKKLSGIKWYTIERFWYIPCTREAYEILKKQINHLFIIDTTLLKQYLEHKKALVLHNDKPIRSITVNKIISYPLCSENLLALEAMRNKLILKGYSVNTIRNYLNEFHLLLRLLKERSINQLSKDHIQSYLLWLLKNKGCSETKVHTAVNAIKFYFEQVKGRGKEFYDLPRPKKPFKLPAILAEEEVLALIKNIENIKHRTMIMASYSGGLRVSEIVALKIKYR